MAFGGSWDDGSYCRFYVLSCKPRIYNRPRVCRTLHPLAVDLAAHRVHDIQTYSDTLGIGELTRRGRARSRLAIGSDAAAIPRCDLHTTHQGNSRASAF